MVPYVNLGKVRQLKKLKTENISTNAINNRSVTGILVQVWWNRNYGNMKLIYCKKKFSSAWRQKCTCTEHPEYKTILEERRHEGKTTQAWFNVVLSLHKPWVYRKTHTLTQTVSAEGVSTNKNDWSLIGCIVFRTTHITCFPAWTFERLGERGGSIVSITTRCLWCEHNGCVSDDSTYMHIMSNENCATLWDTLIMCRQ